MSEAVKLDMFYPYPPERVWQVLTDRRALAAWMMENDFEPKLGHKFRFHSQPLPGLTTTIQCEVVELEAPIRLVYTWQESLTAMPSLVVWTLTPVAGGTQVHLKHHQYCYTAAPHSGNHSVPYSGKVTHSDQQPVLSQAGLSQVGRSRTGLSRTGLSRTTKYSGLSGLEVLSGLSTIDKAQSHAVAMAMLLDWPTSQGSAWDYWLNQRLPAALAQHD